jgi:DNA-binding HxlR family transcriptional regulator
LVAEEFKNFLNSRQIARKRYIEIMKTSIRPSRWIEVKRSLRIITDVSDKQLSNYLKELTYYGFIEKIMIYTLYPILFWSRLLEGIM